MIAELHLLWTTQRDHLPEARACLVDRGPARLLLPTRGTPGVRWKNCTKGIPELFTGLRNIPGRRDRAVSHVATGSISTPWWNSGGDYTRTC